MKTEKITPGAAEKDRRLGTNRRRVHRRTVASAKGPPLLSLKTIKRDRGSWLEAECEILLQEIKEKKELHSELRRRLLTPESETDLGNKANDEPLYACSILNSSGSHSNGRKAMLNVVIVAAECAPYSKTGGLGDVVAALPKYLTTKGHNVTVVVPRYEAYPHSTFTGITATCYLFGRRHKVGFHSLIKDGVRIIFVDHPSYRHWRHDIYGGDRLEVIFRCSLLCKSALEAVRLLPDSANTPPLFVANDWHAALLPLYLKAHYHDRGLFTSSKSVVIVHNIAFQGRGPIEDLNDFDIPLEYRSSLLHDRSSYGIHSNILKGALIHADRIVAVSPQYAWECQTLEGGRGLDDVVREQSHKLHGIVNGIDTEIWNPSTDVHLIDDGYVHYDRDTLEKKSVCKRALQAELGLPVAPDVPLIGYVGRLDDQKGIDLIEGTADWLMQHGAQLVLLGKGNSDLEARLMSLASRHASGCRCRIEFSVPLSHRIIAGSDVMLVPSRYEPCGLTQLYAFAYGTVPVVRSTGGLKDTVMPYDPDADDGNGWSFEESSPSSFQSALEQALETYYYRSSTFREIQLRGMLQDVSWEQPTERYLDVLYGL